MSVASTLLVNFGRIATLIQVLFYLPLALDIAGHDAFLALSASLASYYLFLSTVRLLTKHTRLAWIGQTLAIFQFVVIPACLLVCCNVYSPPSTTIFPPRQSDLGGGERTSGTVVGALINSARGTDAGADFDLEQPSTGSETLDSLIRVLAIVFFYLARRVPGWWYTLLRLSSPFFSLLEGVASLLVIQSLASTSRWIIASSLLAPSTRYQTQGSPSAAAASTPPRKRWFSDALLFRSLSSLGFGASEVWQIFFLLISATTYVCAALALYVSFEGATKDRPGTAAAIAASVTSTVWLTVIAFAIRKGNVIETSLMFAYVVFNIYQLGPSLSFTPDPISLIRSFKVNTHGASFVQSLPSSLQAPLPSKILQALGVLLEVLAHWLGQSLDVLNAAGAALPKSVIVSLIYRLMVLYAAIRILPMLKGSTAVAQREESSLPRRGSWGKTSGSKRMAGAKQKGGETPSDTGIGGTGEARQGTGAKDAYSETETETETESISESGESESEAEVEEYEEEVWDEDEGRWILQKRRRTIRRRRRSRSRLERDADGNGDDAYENEVGEGGESHDEDDREGDQAEEEPYSEDDSGIAYYEKEEGEIKTEKAPRGSRAERTAAANDPAGVKEPPTLPVSDGPESPEAGTTTASSRSSGLKKRPAARASGTKSGRLDNLQSGSSLRHPQRPSPSSRRTAAPSSRADRLSPDAQEFGTGAGSKKRRRRDAFGSSSSSSTSSSTTSSKRRSSKRQHRSASASSSFYGDGDDTDEEPEPFGAFISIVVSYSRLILIAVYSHLLLLDQKNQVYWRFLTVGLTLTLWGLELAISKEDEVDVGGGGGMLAR